MALHIQRAKLMAATIGALTAATLAFGTSPAAAANSYNGNAYVAGGGDFRDDFGDEGILSTSTNTSSNATCLWQKILWADGIIASSEIDGVYGSQTVAATKTWQAKFGEGVLTVDGIVGKDTFRYAAAGLRDWSGDGKVDAFDGTKYDVAISRDAEGRYHFPDRAGNDRMAGYNYRTCS